MNRRQFLKAATSGALYAGLVSSPEAVYGADSPLEMSDLIIVVPGILGSTLLVNKQAVWAPTVGGIDRLLMSLWQTRGGLYLQNDSSTAEALDDGVTADTLMPDIHLVPGLWKVDGYSQLRSEIAAAFKIHSGENYFEFPYDWRRDNRAAAHRLKRVSAQWLTNWRARTGNANAKLVMICHSMGGLVARYFLESLEGWRDTRALVTFGTPYQGAVKALQFIANGYQQDLPIGGPIELSGLSQLLRSFTSVYQLLPTFKCITSFNGVFVAANELASLPNVDMAKLRDAFDFHREIDEGIERNSRNEQYLSNRYAICPVVGIGQPTLVSAKFDGDRLVAVTQTGVLGGDGTVPRISAKPPNIAGTYIAELHASLQNSTVSFGQVEGFLTEPQFVLKGADTERIELELADAYSSTQDLMIRAYPHNMAPPARLLLRLVTSAGQSVVDATAMKLQDDGWHSLQLGPLPPGGYRVTVMAGSNSVTDVFASL